MTSWNKRDIKMKLGGEGGPGRNHFVSRVLVRGSEEYHILGTPAMPGKTEGWLLSQENVNME